MGRASSVFIVYTAVARVAMNVITNALKTFGVSLDAHARQTGENVVSGGERKSGAGNA